MRPMWPMRKYAWILVALSLLAIVAAFLVLRTGRIRLNYPSRERFPVPGIDISHHQGAIDWPSVRDSGVVFAFIKASEGENHLDSRFAENWRESGAAGIVRGPYHFFTFCTAGISQAENFLAVIPKSELTLPPVVDVEFAGNCVNWSTVDRIRAELSAFLKRVERSTSRRPILYLTYDSFHRVADGYFLQYEIWIRNLLWEPSLSQPMAWTFWQYTDAGRISGIKGPVDLNVFRGSLEEFERFTAPFTSTNKDSK